MATKTKENIFAISHKELDKMIEKGGKDRGRALTEKQRRQKLGIL